MRILYSIQSADDEVDFENCVESPHDDNDDGDDGNVWVTEMTMMVMMMSLMTMAMASRLLVVEHDVRKPYVS